MAVDAYTQLNDLENYVGLFAEQGQQALNTLSAKANINFTGLIPDITGFGFVGVDTLQQSLSTLAGAFPSVPTVSIESTVAPAQPAIPTPDQPDVTTDLIDEAGTLVFEDMTNGSYGIDATDEAALLDRARTRQEAEAAAAVDDLNREFQSRRFRVPPGCLYNPLEKSKQSQQDAVAAINREFSVDRADRAFKARQFAIEAASRLDEIRAAVAFQKAMVQEIAARIILQTWQTQVNVWREQVMTAIERARLTLQAAQIDASIYASRIQTTVAAAEVAVATYEAEGKSLLGVVTAQIENAANQLEAYKASYGLSERAAEASASAISALVAGALSATNVLAAQTTTTSA